MDPEPVKNLCTLAAGIIVAYVIAGMCAGMVVGAAGLGGAGTLAGFIVYAIVFVSLLHAMQKYAGIVFFGFGRKNI